MVVFAVEQMIVTTMMRRWKGKPSKKMLGTSWSKQQPPPTRRQLLTALCTVTTTALMLGCCYYVPLSSAFVRRSSSPFQGTLSPSPPFPTDGAAAAVHQCGSSRSRSSPSGLMRVGKTTTGMRVNNCHSGASFNEPSAAAVSRARESKVRSAVSRSATTTTAATAVLPFKAATPSAPSPSGSASSSSSFSSDSPSPSPQSSASEQPNIFSKSLKGLLRGHKCLFDDSHLPNGNLSFLFRGADSSQRYVYPLELKTNYNQLPGAVAAKVMFDLRDAAIATAREVVFGPNVTSGGGKTSREETADAVAASAFGLRSDDEGAGQLVFEDIARFHRVLQYGVAAGLTRFMRNEVLEYNTDLYAETGVNLDALIAAMNAFGRFYDKHITGDQWEKAFNPALQSVVLVMSKMKESISNRRQVGGETESSRSNQMPIAWEDPVDPRTLTSLLGSNSGPVGKAAAQTSSVR